MNFSIGIMTINDFEEVVRLWEQTKGVGLNESDRKPNIEIFLQRNPGLSFVARNQEKKIVGAVLSGHDGRRGYLHHLAVAKECRKKGIGKQLVENCLSGLRACGIQKCNIFLFNDNAEGEEFWKHNGWLKRTDLCMMQIVIE